MATVRDLIKEAVLAFGGIAPGDDLTVEELNVGLTAVQREIRRYHEALGPLTDVDVIADYTAGEDERVRVQNGYTVSVSLPNSIETGGRGTLYDYGFAATTDSPLGSTGRADGISYRAPRDGARVEIVGTTHGLYFYRSDTNAWIECSAVTIDQAMPFNENYLTDFAALIAVRMCKSWPSKVQITPSPQMLREEGQAKLRLYYRHGVVRDRNVGEYF